MRTPKAEIDKRYENKHKDERKAAHAVWGTSMDRGDFEELNKFLKENHIQKCNSSIPDGKHLNNNTKKLNS